MQRPQSVIRRSSEVEGNTPKQRLCNHVAGATTQYRTMLKTRGPPTKGNVEKVRASCRAASATKPDVNVSLMKYAVLFKTSYSYSKLR